MRFVIKKMIYFTICSSNKIRFKTKNIIRIRLHRMKLEFNLKRYICNRIKKWKVENIFFKLEYLIFR